ncbi:VOC family protein [Streptomyces sp. AV19]|uniref:VOC family protein n=1 Tax=Streptomyces sp. AV19 TaxID=2793068 RepID=UPI0018FF0E5D|nr:VOC family protein [Streptomyces sp. AV19]MBH1935264.1 VOC family protein [Streptomyces sp. AV19]MDG4531151.1 VOC family protein [Streptomyces sp. AV19]
MGEATDTGPRSTPCWADVMLPDVDAGKRFYGGLFGWTFRDSGPEYGSYAEAFQGGRAVAALAPKPDGRMPTAWCVHFSSADAAATARRITEAGGQVVTGPLAVGPFGTMLLAVDPGGAVLGVWQAGTHRGFEERGEPGSFAWTEVYTRDAAAVDAFYERVFGLVAHAPGSGEATADYALWTPAGEPPGPEHAVGGRAVMGEDFPEVMPAHFLVHFAVADCDAAAEAAGRLGGRVRRGPKDAPYGRFAVLTDSQGADFAVVERAGAPR